MNINEVVELSEIMWLIKEWQTSVFKFVIDIFPSQSSEQDSLHLNRMVV